MHMLLKKEDDGCTCLICLNISRTGLFCARCKEGFICKKCFKKNINSIRNKCMICYERYINVKKRIKNTFSLVDLAEFLISHTKIFFFSPYTFYLAHKQYMNILGRDRKNGDLLTRFQDFTSFIPDSCWTLNSCVAISVRINVPFCCLPIEYQSEKTILKILNHPKFNCNEYVFDHIPIEYRIKNSKSQ